MLDTWACQLLRVELDGKKKNNTHRSPVMGSVSVVGGCTSGFDSSVLVSSSLTSDPAKKRSVSTTL